MRRFTVLVVVVLLGMWANSLANEINQYYLRFEIQDRKELETLTRVLSLDNCGPIDGRTIYAYANDDELAAFQKLGYDYEILPNPGDLIDPAMSDNPRDASAWDTYPTYEAYVQMMNDFATNYPDLCQVFSIGTSVQGRQLLVAKISDNVSVEENEPEVFYTSSMHGDETTGYILMLRLIDSLLVGYGVSSRITTMVDNMEIYINPLANPDGTYRSGNHTVSGAWRYNANGRDLNRNFPDPDEGPYPDGGPHQPETIAMINFAQQNNFIISANFHGGAEVVNYPWDTWFRRHADDNWFQTISRYYADTAQANSPAGYMTFRDNGITNGWDWYPVAGGRQDMMTYWYGCRETTIELSNVKLVSGSSLPSYWIYNRLSLLRYLENALFGIKGVVTNAQDGQPLSAIVSVVGHDMDSSEVRCDPDHGNYYRMIAPGNYTLRVSAPGFITQDVSGISVLSNSSVTVDVQLQPMTTDPVLLFTAEDAPARIEPGDNVAMRITLTNAGAGNAVNTQGVLSTDDSYITITQTTSLFPTIPLLGGSATSINAYQFSVSPLCPRYYDVDFRLDLTADGGYSDSTFFTLGVGYDIEDFETGDLTAFDWNTSGSQPWVISGSTKYEGAFAAASGTISHSQSSQLSLTTQVAQAGEISFYRKVSSENNWDWLEFYIDGQLKERWSGEREWARVAYPVAAGQRTFLWKYVKDVSVSNGADKGWIDLVIFPRLSSTPVSIITETLPDAWVDQSYEQQLEAVGGSGTLTWSDLNGDLAGTGLTLSGDGMLSGTPVEGGEIEFTAHVVDQSSNSTTRGFSLRVLLCGDADGNSTVTVTDAVLVINFVFAGGQAPDPLELADADCNGMVTVSDAVYLITYVFADGPPPCAACQ